MANLSTLLHPFNQLLQEKHPWQWTAACEGAFQKAKEQLCSAPVLVHYNPKLLLRLVGDASNYGIGAVMFHSFPDGSEHSVAFVSHLASKQTELCTSGKGGLVTSVWHLEVP